MGGGGGLAQSHELVPPTSNTESVHILRKVQSIWFRRVHVKCLSVCRYSAKDL